MWTHGVAGGRLCRAKCVLRWRVNLSENVADLGFNGAMLAPGSRENGRARGAATLPGTNDGLWPSCVDFHGRQREHGGRLRITGTAAL